MSQSTMERLIDKLGIVKTAQSIMKGLIDKSIE